MKRLKSCINKFKLKEKIVAFLALVMSHDEDITGWGARVWGVVKVQFVVFCCLSLACFWPLVFSPVFWLIGLGIGFYLKQDPEYYQIGKKIITNSIVGIIIGSCFFLAITNRI